MNLLDEEFVSDSEDAAFVDDDSYVKSACNDTGEGQDDDGNVFQGSLLSASTRDRRFNLASGNAFYVRLRGDNTAELKFINGDYVKTEIVGHGNQGNTVLTVFHAIAFCSDEIVVGLGDSDGRISLYHWDANKDTVKHKFVACDESDGSINRLLIDPQSSMIIFSHSRSKGFRYSKFLRKDFECLSTTIPVLPFCCITLDQKRDLWVSGMEPGFVRLISYNHDNNGEVFAVVKIKLKQHVAESSSILFLHDKKQIVAFYGKDIEVIDLQKYGFFKN